MKKEVTVAYIGGGSKMWALKFMQDLALASDLMGEVRLYDIDVEAAKRNAVIGNKMQAKEKAVSDFHYIVSPTLAEALAGSDFVVISILPGTFKEMRSDVHAPEKYGIFQSVGDTVGPGGVLRAMRTVPIFEGFAQAIRENCPDAWVINLTNPMTICVKTLYRVFPKIKAFGCCHEVFHTQDFLCGMLYEYNGVKTTRRDIYTDASGINHFTWITAAKYKDIDLMALLPDFIERHFAEGYYPHGSPDLWKTDTFVSGNRIKMDLLKRYGALAAAGDRHLAEFVNEAWYLKDRQTRDFWHFSLTSVDSREEKQAALIKESKEMAEGKREIPLEASGEELVLLMEGILGQKSVISNVNLPNYGQMPQLPLGSVVETNCIFTNGFVDPIVSRPLPDGAAALVRKNSDALDLLSDGIAARDIDQIFAAFTAMPLCAGLSLEEAKDLFKNMYENTREYLTPYYKINM